MQLEEFKQELLKVSKMANIDLKQKEIEEFYWYMGNLIEWNEKMNLTAIIEPKEIIIKHFIDSLTINKYMKEASIIIDVGTGAGFPGIPIKIVNPDKQITLLDSLNKRILFLENVIEELQLNKIEAIHNRAEEIGKNEKYREQYDVSVSRAVAPLNVLVEYLIPFVKLGGRSICMKGPKIEEELEQAKSAIQRLGGRIDKVDCFQLPNTQIERNIIVIEKIKNTPKEFPRKAGIPSKKPI